jgi:hypothetical protein
MTSTSFIRPVVTVPVLSSTMVSTRRVDSRICGPLISIPSLRAAARAGQQRGRRGQPQGAGAGDDQHGDGGGERRLGAGSRAQPEPEGGDGQGDHDGHATGSTGSVRSTCTATTTPTSRPSTPTDVDAIARHITAILIQAQLFPDLRNGPFWDGPRWLNNPSITSRGYLLMAMGVISVALALPLADALAVLRAHAFVVDRTLDDTARDIVSGVLSPSRLNPDSNS